MPQLYHPIAFNRAMLSGGHNNEASTLQLLAGPKKSGGICPTEALNHTDPTCGCPNIRD